MIHKYHGIIHKVKTYKRFLILLKISSVKVILLSLSLVSAITRLAEKRVKRQLFTKNNFGD